MLAMVLAELPPVAKCGPWIAGGSIRRTVGGKEPDSDFDFFFASEGQLADFAAQLEKRSFIKIGETDHHVQYKGMAAGASRLIQLIRFKFYADASAVADSFDFTVCQFVFDGVTLTCGEFSLWDLGRRRLAVHRITYPLSTMRRVLKYANQGFTACPGALTTILTATADDPALRQQLHIHYVD